MSLSTSFGPVVRFVAARTGYSVEARNARYAIITVAQRVSHAIDSIRRGEYEFALQDAAVAIDVTAQRHYGRSRATKRDYKRFLGEYLWLIELMALNGINLEESFFQNLTQTIPGVPRPRFTDLLYHVVRCGLVHDTGIPSNVEFVPGRTLMLADDYIRLPAQVIWGLLAIVVFAKANSAEQSAGDYFLSYKDRQFLIRDHWGREDLLRPLYEQDVKVRVALNITPFDPP